MDSSKLLSPADAAAFLCIAPQTLAVWRCEKRYPLPYVKVGTRVRYRVRDLEQFVASRREAAGAAA